MIDPISAGIVAAGGLASSLLSRGGGMSAKREVALMNYQNTLEENRMKNAYQWAAEDAKKAGFNPVVAFGGNSAREIAGSTPSAGGMSAQMEAGKMNANSNKATTNIQAASQLANVFNELKRVQLENDMAQTNIENKDADTAIKIVNNDLVKKYGDKIEKQRLANSILEGENIKMTNAKLKKEAERLNQEILTNEPEQEKSQQYTSFLKQNPRFAKAMSITGDLVSTLLPVGGFINSMLGGKAALTAAKNMNAKHIYDEVTETYNSRGRRTGVTTKTRAYH